MLYLRFEEGVDEDDGEGGDVDDDDDDVDRGGSDAVPSLYLDPDRVRTTALDATVDGSDREEVTMVVPSSMEG